MQPVWRCPPTPASVRPRVAAGRLLLSFVGGLGHLAPLLPIARAARDAGHEVAVAGSGGLVAGIEDLGFTAYATSEARHHAGVDQERGPLEVMDARATEIEFAANFADRGARRMAAAMPDVVRDFGPDLVLRDETDLGTTIAAEVLGVPVATHLVLASGMLARPGLVAPALDVVRAEHGLAPDPHLTALTSGLVLSDAPPSFRSPRAPLRVTPLHYRSTDAPRPAPRTRPGVYVTLGTIFNGGSGDLFERLLEGLAALDVDVVATVGRGIAPADLGPQPAHVRVERFVPQAEVLPTVDLVVSHGGSPRSPTDFRRCSSRSARTSRTTPRGPSGSGLPTGSTPPPSRPRRSPSAPPSCWPRAGSASGAEPSRPRSPPFPTPPPPWPRSRRPRGSPGPGRRPRGRRPRSPPRQLPQPG